MRIMIKKVGEPPYVEERETLTLEDMQGIVGGYIECLSITPTLDMWLNEEGKLIDLPLNLCVSNNGEIVDGICGDVFFASHDSEGETIGITEEHEKLVGGMYENLAIGLGDDDTMGVYPIMELGGGSSD